ncbi:MAG: phosphoribosylformylglycinamidine synthase subunit PurS [Bacteroidota bacterium]
MFQAKIVVTLRKSILDPQGKAVQHGIHSLGYRSVEDVRIGKFIEMHVDAKTREEAERVTKEACQKLLANPVMEDFSFDLKEVES